MKKLFSIIALFSITIAGAQDYKSFPMWNYRLPLEQRVNDVISRLTLEEKVEQMMNATPAVPRLGIPAYDWWNEVLHGVARTSYHVTSYPQAIGMAATWDTNSLRMMADFSAQEGRAINNNANAMGKPGERYSGLTYWTPNINIFRDPRWGRGQETYGEDPFLTANLGASFVRGLQGNDPVYLQAAACAKHYAVHSGPEASRHSDNFNPSSYDLWDTYLPAFRELVTKAKVAGVMCAYNAINTQPCCANDLLMNDILRRQWGFTGYVTSDCWAIDDFFSFHKTHKDDISAAIDALVHGTDVECGNAVYRTLLNAVKNGTIREEQINISLRRLFTIRFRLGMFDPPALVKYAQTPLTVLESPEHQAQALKMARQSIVLLKNENQILPLSKSIKKIVLLGPNADNPIVLLGNYNGTPSHVTTIREGLHQKLGNDAELVYEQAISYASDTLFEYTNTSHQFSTGSKPGIKAEYFANEKLEGEPAVTQIESAIDHYWNEGEAPVKGVPAMHFSVRYSTTFTADQEEELNFIAEAHDGYRVAINDSTIVDAWESQRPAAANFKLAVKKGKQYHIVMVLRHGEGSTVVKLKTGIYVKTDFAALASRFKDADAIVFAGGISPQLEGEEMPVAVPGFKGGDRTSIRLPAVQTELLKALATTGKPVIFIMLTGSALAIPWEDEHIPAIINAWYGGQSAGTAVADVLFGDYNPAGRLPVTFYKSDSDLPDFSSYDMEGRTYRYFKGEALYPFGYGLSYSHFTYSNMKVTPRLKKGINAKISVAVKNTGTMDGEEVVELYLSHPGISPAPLRALKGFRRIFLKAGETKIINFSLTPEQLSLVSETGQLYQPDGKIVINVGGGQPGVKKNTTSNVIHQEITVH